MIRHLPRAFLCAYCCVIFPFWLGRLNARGKSKAMAAKTLNFNMASVRWRGQLSILLSGQPPPIPHVRICLLLSYLPVLGGRWVNQRPTASLRPWRPKPAILT